MKDKSRNVYAELQGAVDQLLAMYLETHRFVLPEELKVLDLIYWASQKSQQWRESHAERSEIFETS